MYRKSELECSCGRGVTKYDIAFLKDTAFAQFIGCYQLSHYQLGQSHADFLSSAHDHNEFRREEKESPRALFAPATFRPPAQAPSLRPLKTPKVPSEPCLHLQRYRIIVIAWGEKVEETIELGGRSAGCRGLLSLQEHTFST